MRLLYRLCVASLALGALSALQAQQARRVLLAPLHTRGWESPLQADASHAAAGKAVYEEHCAGCHGEDGRALVASNADLPIRPPDLTTYFVESLRDGELFFISTRGVIGARHSAPAMTMPGFWRTFPEQQHWQVVQYLRELRQVRKEEDERALGPFRWDLPVGFPYPRVPADNPMTAEKVELGRHLFYDKRLSLNRTQSCATCHKLELAFTDGKPRGVGSTNEMHPRGAMSLVNVAYSPVLTWANPNLDRLEEQALAPMFGEEPVELGMSGREDVLAERLAEVQVYRELFAAAYPGDEEPYTVDRITKALASFQRTILSGAAPYDRYLRGDAEALSESAKRGEKLFYSERFDCFHCHSGLNFTSSIDYFEKGFAEVEFHNTGVYNVDGPHSYPSGNLGLFEFSRDAADVGKFKPPTLRNIAVTGPYMHDGSIATLGEVIEHYAAGGRTIAEGKLAGVGAENPNKSDFVRGFSATDEEKDDLIAFLESLTDESVLTNPAFGDPWGDCR